MSYILGMSIFQVGDTFITGNITIEIDKCTFEQVNYTKFKYSSFIEQITDNPLLLHASEPVRLSIKADITERESNKLVGTWITIHLLQDASICFAPDHKKTLEMKRTSEYLHKKLKERTNRRNW